MCKLFAGTMKMNQQKVCTSTFYTCANFLLVRRKWTSKKFVLRLLHVCKLFAGSITTSLRFHTKVELTNFLLVHFRRTSKKFALRQFTCVQTFCWFVENEPAKSLHFDFCMGKQTSSYRTSEKFVSSTFCMCANFLLVRWKWTSKKFVLRQFTCVQTFCWFVENEPAKSLSVRLLVAKWLSMLFVVACSTEGGD